MFDETKFPYVIASQDVPANSFDFQRYTILVKVIWVLFHATHGKGVLQIGQEM